MLFLFDQDFDLNQGIEVLTNSKFPDSVEIGENNKYWVMVNRQTKQIELMSKIDGRMEFKFPPDEAWQYGLNATVVKVAKHLLGVK